MVIAVYFWYLPKEEKKVKEEIVSDELLEEFEKLKTFEEDIGFTKEKILTIFITFITH